MIIYMSQTINLIAKEKGIEEAKKIASECIAYPLKNGIDAFFVVNEPQEPKK